MNSFKVAIPRTAKGELPEGKGEILGHPFTFTHSNVDASKPFNLAIFSNDLNRNDAFSAAVLLTSTLCLVKHKKSVGLYPKNTHAVEGTHQYEYVGSCSRK